MADMACAASYAIVPGNARADPNIAMAGGILPSISNPSTNSASSDDRITVFAEHGRYGVCSVVRHSSRQRARGSEHCNGGWNFAKHFKSLHEFRHNAKNPPSILTCEVINDILLFNAVSFHLRILRTSC